MSTLSSLFFDYVVIGGGVVGICIGRALSNKFANKSILLTEKNRYLGQETSSRNSQVIHSGIYYKKDSLKSKLCLKGRDLLYNYLSNHNIPFRKIGKLVVATSDDQVALLNSLIKNASEVDVNVKILNTRDAKDIEPNIKCVKAIYVDSTGVFDSNALVDSLENCFSKKDNSILSKQSEVVALDYSDGIYKLNIKQSNTGPSSSDTFEITTPIVINSSGLHAHLLFNKLSGNRYYEIEYLKGQYFKYNSKERIFKHLVYPLPDKATKTLGIHSTLDLNNTLKFGPDARLINKIDYNVNEGDKQKFLEAIRTYCKYELDPRRLEPDYSGIRPRIADSKNNKANVVDFVIRDERDRGLPGFINLIGIESPGLTSCLAIAEYVLQILGTYQTHNPNNN